MTALRNKDTHDDDVVEGTGRSPGSWGSTRVATCGDWSTSVGSKNRPMGGSRAMTSVHAISAAGGGDHKRACLRRWTGSENSGDLPNGRVRLAAAWLSGRCRLTERTRQAAAVWTWTRGLP